MCLYPASSTFQFVCGPPAACAYFRRPLSPRFPSMFSCLVVWTSVVIPPDRPALPCVTNMYIYCCVTAPVCQEFIDICDLAVGLSRSINGKVIPSERPGHTLLEFWNPLVCCRVVSALVLFHLVGSRCS